MNEEIFRKKSLNRIKSPETLDDYIKVSNPGVWLLLICIVVLLIGTCVWAIFGHIDSVVSTTVSVKDGMSFCYINENAITSIKEGLTVIVSNNEVKIEKIGDKTDLGYECILDKNLPLSNGYYEGKIILKSYQPLSFVFN